MALSPVPDVGEMPRETARDEEDGVDPDNVAGACEPRGQALGGDRDPAQAILIERPGGGFLAVALLHLDECDGRTTPRNEANLPTRDPRADRKDPPAVQPQPPRRNRFGAAAALLGDPPFAAPVQARLRSSARA